MAKPTSRTFAYLFLSVLLTGSLNCAGCTEGRTTTNNGAPEDTGVSDAAISDVSDAEADASGDDTGSPDGAGDASEDDADVPQGPECGDKRCAVDEECVEDTCLPPCGGTRCGADLGLCCTGGDLCLGGGCVTPGSDCERTEQCAVDAICEPTVGQCVPRSSVEVCEFVPPVGEFTPEIGCTWPPPDLAVDTHRTHAHDAAEEPPHPCEGWSLRWWAT